MDTTEQPTVQKVKIEFRQMVSFYIELTQDEFMDLHEEHEDTLTADQMNQIQSTLRTVFEKLTKRKKHLIIERIPHNCGKQQYAGPESTSCLEIRHALFMGFGIFRALLMDIFGVGYRQ